MSKIEDLLEILGGNEELARAILDKAKDWTDELKALGIAYKSLSDITDQLDDLSVAELRKLKDKVAKLLTEKGEDEYETPAYAYRPSKEKDYTSPLDKSLEAGIAEILAAKRETKQKAANRGFFERGHKVSDDIDEIVHYRNTKGKGGRWSGPPIELTGQASIEAIERWRREHGQ